MGKLQVLTAGLSIGKAKEDVLGRYGLAKETVGQGFNPSLLEISGKLRRYMFSKAPGTC